MCTQTNRETDSRCPVSSCNPPEAHQLGVLLRRGKEEGAAPGVVECHFHCHRDKGVEQSSQMGREEPWREKYHLDNEIVQTTSQPIRLDKQCEQATKHCQQSASSLGSIAFVHRLHGEGGIKDIVRHQVGSERKTVGQWKMIRGKQRERR